MLMIFDALLCVKDIKDSGLYTGTKYSEKALIGGVQSSLS